MGAPLIILASKSASRRWLLENAGLSFQTRDADIDEGRIKSAEAKKETSPELIAIKLACAKAQKVSRTCPDDFVVGCDQLLTLDSRIFDKPASIDEAAKHLQQFRGRSHQLISAVSICYRNDVIWTHVDRADMHVRDFSDTFLSDYLDTAGDDILGSVGAYKLEGLGSSLFDRIDGDYFTILGLPLLPLLEELRNHGILLR